MDANLRQAYRSSAHCAGEKYLTNEEADSKGEGPKKPVTATLDLYEAIESGAPAHLSLVMTQPNHRNVEAPAPCLGCEDECQSCPCFVHHEKGRPLSMQLVSCVTGDHPQWDLYIQTMDPAIEDTLDFDPLDSTKTWPEVGHVDPPLPAAPGAKFHA